MANVLVLFDTQSGGTGKMAQLVAEGATRREGTVVRLRAVEQAKPEDVEWCDGIAVGTPTHMGGISWKMKRFWDDDCRPLWGKLDGRIGCAFSSGGGWGGGHELVCLQVLVVLMNFGFLTFGVTDYIVKGFTLHYGAVLHGEPRDDEEKEACRRLGERLAQWSAQRRAGLEAAQK